MSKCATLPFLRHPRLTYLRSASPQALRRSCFVGVSLVSLVLACTLPPDVAARTVTPSEHALWRAYLYWCSLLVGAAPYLAGGALAALAASRLQALWQTRRGVARWLRYSLPCVAAACSGCDCSLVSYAGALRTLPVWLSGFTLSWSACCNVVALFCTARVLGERLLFARILGGFIAAALTAGVWARIDGSSSRAPAGQSPPRDCSCEPRASVAGFVQAGLRSFTISAAVAALLLALAPRAFVQHGSILSAALAGALLSPCSSSDALLARSLFHLPAEHLAFIMAAQCFDVRQMILLHKQFGGLAAACAFACAAFATCCACLVLARSPA